MTTPLFDRAKKVSPGGVHSPVRAFRGVGGTPVFVQSAKGSRLTDVEGKSYLDFCLAWGPLILGHQDEEVLAEVQSALRRGWSFGTAEPYSLELAELIVSKIPWVQKIRFVNSGTEAVMSALRVARAATKRDKILKFDGCYHGHVDSMLVRAGSGLAEMASPDSAGVSASTASETLVCPLDDENVLKKIFEKHGNQIAAVIIEPLPANNGLLIQRESFLKQIQSLARQSGALLIFDEVISGFRVEFGGMAEKTKITPDLVTYGKIIGGGFPVGAYGGRADLMDLVAPAGPVYQAGTLSANPVAMVAGLATLKKLLRDQPYAKLAQKTDQVGRALLDRVQGKLPFGFQIQNEASLFWPVLGQAPSPVRAITQIPSTQKELFAIYFHELLKKGFYIAPSGYEVGFLSTAHTDTELEQFVDASTAALLAVKEKLK